MKYNAVWVRELTIFDKDCLKTTKVEKEILADNLYDAAKIACKTKFKGFILLGIKQVTIITLFLLLLTGCASTHKWSNRYERLKTIEPPQAERFFCLVTSASVPLSPIKF